MHLNSLKVSGLFKGFIPLACRIESREMELIYQLGGKHNANEVRLRGNYDRTTNHYATSRWQGRSDDV